MTIAKNNLLVELLVEELPPKALRNLGHAFAEAIFSSLEKSQLVAETEHSALTSYATPRRLAVHIPNVLSKAEDRPVSQKLMPVNVGLDDQGAPTAALLKKLASLGVSPEVVPSLTRKQDGKLEALFHDSMVAGATLSEGLQTALDFALSGLPIPKVMTYQLADGWDSVRFVRPAHGLVALHGTDVVACSALGLNAGRESLGHRFESTVDKIVLKDADGYSRQMENEGAVIASFEARRDNIALQLAQAAEKENLVPIADEELLDEVAALVERPNILLGQFEPEYLDVPQECLILTMKANQKYFPLMDSNGKLTNKFLIVSNITPDDPGQVIRGNERVVRPRLADAKFFFDQDRKKKLATRIEKLGGVVYHNRLGSQLQRVERIAVLAGTIARLLGADKADAEVAARLSKADLLTDMVGEFPELQGIMGRYYALHDGEKQEVADAIEAHYHPRFAGDSLPQGNIACALTLADKLETLVGIYGIGQVPTGDKDPFGLRRHALGILRILIETPIDLPLGPLLKKAADNFPEGLLSDTVIGNVESFMQDRLRGYLRDLEYDTSHIDAVLNVLQGRVHEVLPRLDGLRAFASLEVAKDLAAANKRVQNIMRKNHEEIGLELNGATVNRDLFQEEAERDLYQAIQDITPFAENCLARRDYQHNLKALVTLKPFIDDFFEKVMVMSEDKDLRLNRAALLLKLGNLMNQVADISKLAS
ncbi:MAG: glycine--tRNA ligase subunit beta [Gallionella sp.]